MAYNRYDQRNRENRSRYLAEDRETPRAGYSDDPRGDRGFFERAGDTVASWFGDEEAQRRREWDDREPRDYQQRTSYGDYERAERGPRYGQEPNRRPYTGQPFAGSPTYGDFYGVDRSSQSGRWDRGITQRQEPQSASGLYDRDYSCWRNRQIDNLDRDYADFRRENSARFENEFTTWRGQRQAKRQTLGSVTEHMEVVGSDMKAIGKVDYVKNDKVVLTKQDSPDGRHHTIGLARIDRVEKDKLVLDMPSDDVKQRFEQQQRSGALFDRDIDEGDGPHVLNRSFSGTY